MVTITGTIDGIQKTVEGENILLVVLESTAQDVEKLRNKRVKIDIRTNNRSLNANAYFHVLCEKLRTINKVSFAHQKNDLITTYGQIDYISEGQPIIYKTNAPPEYISEREEIHLKYIKCVDDCYFYKVYRGSHTYDTKEMAQLIDGTITECKAAGIETLSPFEINKMLRESK